MTADDALALIDAAAGWLETLTGAPLAPAERDWIHRRVAEFVAPRLDERARMTVLVRRDALDLAMGKAALLEDGRVWRGEEDDQGGADVRG